MAHLYKQLVSSKPAVNDASIPLFLLNVFGAIALYTP